ncbi:MAG: hypothetical protein RLY88_576 [Actinomycetota bacterium]
MRFPIRTLIAASHGTDNSSGALAISRLVTKVNEALNPADVREAFVDVQQPDVPTVLAQVDQATIVPLLLATGYHVRQDIADAAFEHGQATITPALGPDQRLVDVLVQRLNEAGHQADDLVVLTVAGSSDPRAQAETNKVKAMLEASLGKTVELAFLSAAEPKLKDLVPKLKFQNPRKRIVVSTYLLAPGYFSDLLQKVGAHLVTNPLLSPEIETPQQLIDIVIERYQLGQVRSGQTGCLDGLSGQPFEGCAAGCASACR